MAPDPRPTYGPVDDWTTDFDILDADYVADPTAIWDDLRASCPIARTERYGPTWLPVRYDDLAAIAHDAEHFSSRDVAVITPGRHLDADRVMTLEAPPITSDPPVHTWARRLLLPRFTPAAVDALAATTTTLADRLIDRLDGRREADGAGDYARHIPVAVIAEMLGVPARDEAAFTAWTVAILQEGFQDVGRAAETSRELIAYFAGKLDERERVPADERPDDLLTLLVEARRDDGPLDDRHRIGSCFLLLVAGIDTTWSAIGAGLWHLATHPDDQQRLRDEPDLLPLAVEELLRYYSPVTMARYVREDTTVGGCPMRRGDKVLLAFPAGNRDPEQFDEPDRFVIDRARNRHVAFGTGAHRCLGSNLARMELRVALERFLARVPTFALRPGAPVTWSSGQVRGPATVPLRW